MAVYGHKQCKSNAEVVEKESFDAHTHGNITRSGKIRGISEPTILFTDEEGNIIASRTFDGNLVIHGTITADKVVGAVYA